MNDRPLVTFALFAYNQERFIREAVEGAFSQTYSPLEIILSDDCSPDRTFDIMREMASQYTGPHEIVLNRNDANLGLGGHVNRVNEIARGELIVAAAGDDVSLPNRCDELVGYWRQTGRRLKAILGNYVIVDEDGREIRENPGHERPLDMEMLLNFEGMRGCSQSWTKDVFTQFGPILPDTVHEDCVIAMRSYLLGGVGYCDRVLVRYRIHGSNISHSHGTTGEEILRERIESHRRFLNVYDNYRRDLVRAGSMGLIDKRTLTSVLDALERHAELRSDKAGFLQGNLAARMRLIRKHMFKNPVHAIPWLLILASPSIYLNMGRNNPLGRLTLSIYRVVARFRRNRCGA